MLIYVTSPTLGPDAFLAIDPEREVVSYNNRVVCKVEFSHNCQYFKIKDYDKLPDPTKELLHQFAGGFVILEGSEDSRVKFNPSGATKDPRSLTGKLETLSCSEKKTEAIRKKMKLGLFFLYFTIKHPLKHNKKQGRMWVISTQEELQKIYTIVINLREYKNSSVTCELRKISSEARISETHCLIFHGYVKKATNILDLLNKNQLPEVAAQKTAK